ncbi:hypothetical protein ACFFKU_07825 [Kineococcus gynurae]|uniref:DNA-binding protein n=1 Tax=Kineococcus gynurae TaxID=452979 RepID=A0ABV5LWF0_9ACTN
MTQDNRESLDALLRSLLAQGRMSTDAERLARDGVDRLRAFLRDGSAAGREDPAGSAVPAEDEAADAEIVHIAVEDVETTQVHTVPLAGGRTATLELPTRFGSADADRVAAVLTALALDEE